MASPKSTSVNVCQVSFSSNGRYCAVATDAGPFVYQLNFDNQSETIRPLIKPDAENASFGARLVAIESGNRFVWTGNDSSNENSSRCVRLTDFSGAAIAFRVTQTPILALRIFKPSTKASDDDASIIIVTETMIYIYDGNLDQCMAMIPTDPNPHGAIGVSHSEPLKIAYPNAKYSGVTVSTIQDNTQIIGEKIKPFANGACQYISFSPSDHFIAAADATGMQIYVFSLDQSQSSSDNSRYYNRGKSNCLINSIEFRSDNEDILLCSSDHGTVHVFDITSTAWNATNFLSGTKYFAIKDLSVPQETWAHFAPDPAHIIRVSPSSIAVYNMQIPVGASGYRFMYSRNMIIEHS